MTLNIIDLLKCTNMMLPEPIETVGIAFFGITDCTLSVITMLLFFRPVCNCRNRVPIPSSSDESVVTKYGILSALQLFAAISYQTSMLLLTYLEIINCSEKVWIIYNNISYTIQTVDSVLLMICIFFGFARKQTVFALMLYSRH